MFSIRLGPINISVDSSPNNTSIAMTTVTDTVVKQDVLELRSRSAAVYIPSTDCSG